MSDAFVLPLNVVVCVLPGLNVAFDLIVRSPLTVSAPVGLNVSDADAGSRTRLSNFQSP